MTLTLVEYHWSMMALLYPRLRRHDPIQLSGYDGVIVDLWLRPIEASCSTKREVILVLLHDALRLHASLHLIHIVGITVVVVQSAHDWYTVGFN